METVGARVGNIYIPKGRLETMTRYKGDTSDLLAQLRKIREGTNMPCEDIVDLVDEAMNVEGRMLNALYDPKPGVYFPHEDISKIKQLHLEAHTAFDIVAEKCCLKDVQSSVGRGPRYIDADAERSKCGIQSRANAFVESGMRDSMNRSAEKERKTTRDSIIDAELRKPIWTRSGR